MVIVAGGSKFKAHRPMGGYLLYSVDGFSICLSWPQWSLFTKSHKLANPNPNPNPNHTVQMGQSEECCCWIWANCWQMQCCEELTWQQIWPIYLMWLILVTLRIFSHQLIICYELSVINHAASHLTTNVIPRNLKPLSEHFLSLSHCCWWQWKCLGTFSLQH